MTDSTPATAACPRCGQHVDPLDDTYTLSDNTAHIICPLPEPPAA